MKGAVNADVSKVGPVLIVTWRYSPGFSLSVLYQYDATFVKTMLALVVNSSVCPTLPAPTPSAIEHQND